MDHITKKANPEIEMLNELGFADDQGLIKEDDWQLQKQVTGLNRACEEHDMQISTNKIEFVT